MPLVYKTLIPILVILIGTTLVVGSYFRDTLVDTLFEEQFLETKEIIENAARDVHLQDAVSSPLESESASTFARFLDRVKSSVTARVTVWSPNSTIIFSDLSSIVGTASPAHPALQEVVARNTATSIKKDVDDGTPLQSAVGPFLDIYVPLADAEGVFAVVEIHAVQGAILNPLYRGLNNAGYLVVVGLLITVAAITVLLRLFILSPLGAAGTFARKISTGDFSTAPLRSSQDEIGELFRNLEQMRIRLASLVGRLETKVEERTAELKEEETRLAASLGSLSVGFLIFNEAGALLYRNPAIENIIGKKESSSLESIATFFKNAVPLKDAFTNSMTKRVVLNESAISVGTQFFRLFLAPIVMRNGGEHVLGAVLLVEDVTEAKALDRAKDDFLSIASHELRTPLTAIRLNAELLKSTFLKTQGMEEARSMVDDIHVSSLRLIKIVHDFLDIAALEQGVPLVAQDDINIKTLIAEVVEQLLPLATEKNLSLQIQKHTKVVPSFKTDASRLKQVLVNLVGNAIRYTKKGYVELSFAAEGNTLIIRVRDTGVGIIPEHQALLFKKFQQANESVLTREHSQGTGLGLYISRLIMSSMGGSVTLESSVPGKGSVFAVSLPLS